MWLFLIRVCCLPVHTPSRAYGRWMVLREWMQLMVGLSANGFVMYQREENMAVRAHRHYVEFKPLGEPY